VKAAKESSSNVRELWYAFYNTDEHPGKPPQLNANEAWYYGKCKDFLTTNKQKALVTWKRPHVGDEALLVGRRICCPFNDSKFYYGTVTAVEKRGKKVLKYIVTYDDGITRKYNQSHVLTMLRVQVDN